MAHKVEELPIHTKVVAFWRAINATLEHSKLRRDSEAYEQISRANDSIPSNLVEGFEQSTDKSFANFVGYSKGSLAEVLKRLRKAYYRRLVTADELRTHLEAGEELGKMLGGVHEVPAQERLQGPRLAEAAAGAKGKEAPQVSSA